MSEEGILDSLHEGLRDIHQLLLEAEGKERYDHEAISGAWLIADALIDEIREYFSDNRWFLPKDLRE